MSDIIKLLPDSIANQIAAGEVIQRPASVVKELVENAIDAGSTEIKIIIKDAGKSLIQIIDDGAGMSVTDARMSFERHATSKISKADDLFALKTLGFRGEALASIAAVAQVELKTKKDQDELGTLLVIHGSEIIEQQAINCPKGSNFLIKNLFYNVPARRKFLKNDTTEFSHIVSEIVRVAIPHPEISFSLYHNDACVYNLVKTTRKIRISHLFNKSMLQNLATVDVESPVLTISGYVGKPEIAKKKNNEQYFFVNGRYMKNAFFNKAVMLAYEQIIPHDYQPTYFLFFDIAPNLIDVNIHPTKTEINFENASGIFQMLKAAVKNALGKINITPSIDFDTDGSFEFTNITDDTEIVSPTITVDTNYNPFEIEEEQEKPKSHGKKSPISNQHEQNLRSWQNLFSDFENQKDEQIIYPENNEQLKITHEDEKHSHEKIFQIQNKYIVTSVKSGIMLIHQKRAHERILYDSFINTLSNQAMPSQQTLFPSTIELNPDDYAILLSMIDELKLLGFDIREIGKQSFVINGIPAMIENSNPQLMIQNFLQEYKNSDQSDFPEIKELIANALAVSSAIHYQRKFTIFEMKELIDKLFSSEVPNYSPSGKLIVSIIDFDKIEKMF